VCIAIELSMPETIKDGMEITVKINQHYDKRRRKTTGRSHTISKGTLLSSM
jgi:hypothetical protein